LNKSLPFLHNWWEFYRYHAILKKDMIINIKLLNKYFNLSIKQKFIIYDLTFSFNQTFTSCAYCTFSFDLCNDINLYKVRNWILCKKCKCISNECFKEITKGCFISFDPLIIFLLSLPYSIVERYWTYIFEEQHLSYQSKKLSNLIEP
jgi:hypothetical protein